MTKRNATVPRFATPTASSRKHTALREADTVGRRGKEKQKAKSAWGCGSKTSKKQFSSLRKKKCGTSDSNLGLANERGQPRLSSSSANRYTTSVTSSSSSATDLRQPLCTDLSDDGRNSAAHALVSTSIQMKRKEKKANQTSKRSRRKRLQAKKEEEGRQQQKTDELLSSFNEAVRETRRRSMASVRIGRRRNSPHGHTEGAD